MSKRMFKAISLYLRIEPIIVERCTEVSYWEGGRRSMRYTEYATVHATWEEAHAGLINACESEIAIANRRIEQAQKQLERAHSHLLKAEELTPSEDTDD